jgi:hypothetical protein
MEKEIPITRITRTFFLAMKNQKNKYVIKLIKEEKPTKKKKKKQVANP